MTNLRKIFVVMFFCMFMGVTMQAKAERPLYPDEYIRRFEVCGAYEDHLLYNVDTKNMTLKLNSKETIVGIRDGKCVTKSRISLRTNSYVLADVTCSFNSAQRKNFAEKMKSAKINTLNRQIYEIARKSYLSNPEVCKVKDYTVDD